MAITKLMHIKESRGCPHDHLRNAIYYILDVRRGGEKTNHGALIGGNAGLECEEILENFLETKREYGKMNGRQGYHFVLSFAKGETDATTAYSVVREFCEQYLGDAYDYVFAIHTDKEHLHGHIIFNSVSRESGYKYHYKKGDWEKSIQPVTDRICVEHNLSPLTFEEERAGVPYASWAAKKNGQYNWTHIIRADIDFAIQQADSYEEFQKVMERMNYQLREGYSKKLGKPYITFQFIAPDGKAHSRRSYKLPAGYAPEEIRQRILTKEGSRSYEEILEGLSRRSADSLRSSVLKSTRTFTRLYQTVSYYKLPNPYAVPAYQVRQDMIHIQKLLEECRYLQINGIHARKELEYRIEQLNDKLQKHLSERRTYSNILDRMTEEELAAAEQYSSLCQQLRQMAKADDGFELLEDEISRLEEMYPNAVLEAKDKLALCRQELSSLRKEKRILERILQTECSRDAGIRPGGIKK